MDVSVERQIVERALSGNQGAFGEIYRAYYDQIKTHLLKLTKNDADADDLVHDVFTKAFRSIATFRFDQKGLRPWLHRIATNTFISFYQRRKKYREILDEEIRPIAMLVEETRVELPNSSDHLPDWCLEILVCLPEKMRECVILSDLRGLEYQQIAEHLDVPIGTVKSRLFRGRRIAREAIIERGLQEEVASYGLTFFKDVPTVEEDTTERESAKPTTNPEEGTTMARRGVHRAHETAPKRVNRRMVDGLRIVVVHFLFADWINTGMLSGRSEFKKAVTDAGAWIQHALRKDWLIQTEGTGRGAKYRLNFASTKVIKFAQEEGKIASGETVTDMAASITRDDEAFGLLCLAVQSQFGEQWCTVAQLQPLIHKHLQDLDSTINLRFWPVVSLKELLLEVAEIEEERVKGRRGHDHIHSFQFLGAAPSATVEEVQGGAEQEPEDTTASDVEPAIEPPADIQSGVTAVPGPSLGIAYAQLALDSSVHQALLRHIDGRGWVPVRDLYKEIKDSWPNWSAITTQGFGRFIMQLAKVGVVERSGDRNSRAIRPPVPNTSEDVVEASNTSAMTAEDAPQELVQSSSPDLGEEKEWKWVNGLPLKLLKGLIEHAGLDLINFGEACSTLIKYDERWVIPRSFSVVKSRLRKADIIFRCEDTGEINNDTRRRGFGRLNPDHPQVKELMKKRGVTPSSVPTPEPPLEETAEATPEPVVEKTVPQSEASPEPRTILEERLEDSEQDAQHFDFELPELTEEILSSREKCEATLVLVKGRMAGLNGRLKTILAVAELLKAELGELDLLREQLHDAMKQHAEQQADDILASISEETLQALRDKLKQQS